MIVNVYPLPLVDLSVTFPNMKRLPADLYLPPWKNPATPSPPRTWDQYFVMKGKWDFSLEGGGLWDWDRDPTSQCEHCKVSENGMCYKHLRELGAFIRDD
jgi:hypothetical protein